MRPARRTVKWEYSSDHSVNGELLESGTFAVPIR